MQEYRLESYQQLQTSQNHLQLWHINQVFEGIKFLAGSIFFNNSVSCHFFLKNLQIKRNTQQTFNL